MRVWQCVTVSAVSLHHVRVGGDGRHCPDPSMGLPETTQRRHSRGAQQEAGQQGSHHSNT